MTPSKWKQQLTLELPEIQAKQPVWVHACSVGEVGSVAPLIRKLCKEGYAVHLSVVTRTGYAHAERLFGDSVSKSWLPWDLPGLMRRFISHLKPSVLLLCETEFWPGMLNTCKKRNIPVIGVNTRISDRSFPKYHATRALWSRWLSAVHLFLAQSEIDAERLAQMGVPEQRIKAVGNLKFAVEAPEVDSAALRQKLDASSKRPILIVASTHDNEEAQIIAMLDAFTRITPDLLTLIVPRHPERFDEVAGLLTQHNIAYTRYEEARTGDETVILVDAMGVLTQLYTIADLVFIGGSLVNIGGHNPLEAAVCGRGVITGAHVQNFRSVMQQMQQQGSAIIAADKKELEATICRMLEKPDELQQLNAQASLFMQAGHDVLEHMWQEIQPFLKSAR